MSHNSYKNHQPKLIFELNQGICEINIWLIFPHVKQYLLPFSPSKIAVAWNIEVYEAKD